MWQVRHKFAGLFMGVNHGKGHYSNISDCCRSLGVFQFTSPAQIESLFEMADSPHLPDHARLKREDFIVEEWDLKIHSHLTDQGLIDDCQAYLHWAFETFPVGLN